jgi:hypothetical protein
MRNYGAGKFLETNQTRVLNLDKNNDVKKGDMTSPRSHR